MITNILQPHIDKYSNDFSDQFTLIKLDFVMINQKVIKAIKSGEIEVKNNNNEIIEPEYKQKLIKLKE